MHACRNLTYGMWREDIRKPDGHVERRQRKARLGTVSELPTRTQAREKLAELMGRAPTEPVVEMTLTELVERWKLAAVPTIKGTTATYYLKTLRAHIIPAFGQAQIRSLGRYDVEAFLARQAPMYCRNTLRGMRVSLGHVMSWAVACGCSTRIPARE